MGEQMIELQGFAADLDPQTPGIILSCDNIIPTRAGFEPLASLQGASPQLIYMSIGAYTARFLDGSYRVFAGGTTQISELSGSWVDVSGSLYSTATGGRWRFASFGNHVIATNFSDPVQYSTNLVLAPFADLPDSPPRAKFVESVNQFVFLLNTEFAPNQWWCSGVGTDSIWVPDIATQAANGQLDDTPGPITGAKALGADLIIFKLRSMYIAQYLGPPLIWGFQRISSETGCASHEAVVSLGDRLVFPGYQDFYLYSGGRPQALQSPNRQFFFEEDLDENYWDRVIGRWDQFKQVVFWHYPSKRANPPGTLDSWIAWHPGVNRWTMGRKSIQDVMLPEFPLASISTGADVTYDEFGNLFATYDDITGVTYDAPGNLGASQAFGQAVFIGNTLYSYTGVPGLSYFMTGDMGDDLRFAYLTRVKPKFRRYPTRSTRQLTYGELGDYFDTYADLPFPNPYGAGFTSTTNSIGQLTDYFKINLGDTLFQHVTADLADQGWFNLRKSARFHRFIFRYFGDYEQIGFQPVLRDGGAR